MKKELLALCVAVVAVSGCGNSDSESARETRQSGVDMAALAGATMRNFGEIGGDPWGKPTTFNDENPATSMYLGRSLAVADIDGNGLVEIISSKGNHTHHGQVVIQWDSGSVTSYDFRNETDEDNFGAVVVAGQFCPEITSGGMIVASAPDNANSAGGFGLIYKPDNGKIYKTWKRLTNGSGSPEMMGVTFAVDDVDGDGKYDIVYRSTPVNDNGRYQNSKVGVILDFCSQNGTVVAADEITGTTTGFGSAIYVRKLDESSAPEIIIVDQKYTEESNTSGVPNGAVFFYKFENGKLVSSRQPVTGETTENGGEGIVSVAFSDLDRDGDLDMLVGASKYSGSAVREGRVSSFKNSGPGGAFHRTSLWSATSGREDANYGANLITADLNFDGYNELIVAAPGAASNANQEINGSEGYVYVYLGTRKGTFSSDAFWTYNSHVPLNRNDQFGTHIAVANLDENGWLDLVVTAPNYSPTKPESISRAGRIDLFVAETTPCYVANRCMVDNVCYKNGESPKDNKCLVCKPMQNNFELVPIVCDETMTDECNFGAICEPETGCTIKFADEGTACGKIDCHDNVLSHGECKQGVCVSSEEDCGNNVCSVDKNMCIATCETDADCGSEDFICVDQLCTEIVNNPPVIIISNMFTAHAGDSIVLDASASYDPEDGQKITFSWTGDDVSLLSATDIANPILSIPDDVKDDHTYSFKVKATDHKGAFGEADVTIKILPKTDNNHPPVVVLSPEFTVRPGQSVVLDASKSNDPDGDAISYLWSGVGSENLDDVKSASPTFKVPGNIETGHVYDLVLTVTDEKGASSTASTHVNVSLAANQVPIAVLTGDVETIIPGDPLKLDASQSSDPDGDPLTYRWEYNCDIPTEMVELEASENTISVTVADSVDYDTTCIATVNVIDSLGSSSHADYTFNVKGVNNPPVAVLPATLIYEGEPLLIDGSASNDPDGDELKYEWTVSEGAELSFDDENNNTMASFNAIEPSNGAKFTVTLTVTDRRGAFSSAETVITYVKPSTVAILSPVNEEDVEAEFDISGVASGFAGIAVFDRWDRELCTAEVASDLTWTCHVTEKTGRLMLVANGLDKDNVRVYATEPIIVNVHGAEPEVIPQLAITSPLNAEIVDLRPTVRGTSENLNGFIVNVWSVEGEGGTLLCSTEINSDGSWECNVGSDLAFDTEYVIRATVTDVYEATSESVTFRSRPDTAKINFMTPVEDGKYPVNYPIIFAGTADADASIAIYAGLANDEKIVCETTATSDGKWACPSVMFTVGEYSVFADDASDEILYPTNPFTFKVSPSERYAKDEDPDGNNPHGGACSATPMGGQNSAWILLLAAGAGLGLLRRRKESK